ncbi:MAG TPA: AgmX/PglI C-terminal domain-containing protein [Polyangiaceae bacterium]|nr:AgmX/PglI C-terminal domain-containing protein [Polyangiaceae bacterium]HPB94889.1 AgmX/PglI C-terminal domain-containing protein [Polyangiaceae bacterium]HPY18678.1 AgmX/PglI C-terminal domain-containing protein [Polyangiaceae bacterium]HQB44830.1 AgmX/PglI C-terminal domain-containing protein [Polyangiaceae bacterium]HQF25801.1 AgmX/PglI C-terminal domain-containing protein [Polyangiaceae bacterium]
MVRSHEKKMVADKRGSLDRGSMVHPARSRWSLTPLAIVGVLIGCASTPPASTPAPEPFEPEPEAPVAPPEPKPEPEAGRVELSTAFLVGGDMPSSTRDQVTAQVVQAINDASSSFRKCYAKAVARGHSPKGEIDIELLIRPGGSIGALRPGKGTLTEEELVACTVRVFERLEWPSPPADYSIIAPIQYYPE